MLVLPAHDALLPRAMTVQRAIKETADTFTLDLDPGADGFAFAPGQFNMITAFGVGESAISISGSPHKPSVLTHTIRAVGGVTRALQQLKRGDSVGVRGPYGAAWPMAKARGHDVIIVTGGIGLAPLRPAILDILDDRAAFGKVCLAYGARAPREILFPKQLATWRGRVDVDVEITVDRGDVDWRGDIGVVTKLLGRFEVTPQNTVALLCGPEVMMRFAARDLVHLGVPADQVYLSMERNMKCAVGSCGHCQLGPTFICKNGPVYTYPQMAPLMAVREL